MSRLRLLPWAWPSQLASVPSRSGLRPQVQTPLMPASGSPSRLSVPARPAAEATRPRREREPAVRYALVVFGWVGGQDCRLHLTETCTAAAAGSGNHHSTQLRALSEGAGGC